MVGGDGPAAGGGEGDRDPRVGDDAGEPEAGRDGPAARASAAQVDEVDRVGDEGAGATAVRPLLPPTTADKVTAGVFIAAAVAGLALLVVYVRGGNPQAEGVLLAIVLGGIGIGLVRWSHEMVGPEPAIEERPPLESAAARRREFITTLEESSRPVSRRRLLLASVTAAGLSLLAALLLPIRSLGPSPGRALFRTSWRNGRRMVTAGGQAVAAEDLRRGNVLTVFPEGHEQDEDAATLLIRVDPEDLELPADRMEWAPEGLVAYSKICTHVGCPVGLYRESTHELVCPCHQSTFNVLRGAEPVFGPATRPLPQLPIAVDDDGYVVATGDYPEPTGPGFWNWGT